MARRAGRYEARKPTADISAATAPIVIGSWGATPKSWCESTRVAARLARSTRPRSANAEYHEGQARFPERELGDEAAQAPGRGDGHVPVHRPDFAAHALQEGEGRPGRTHHDPALDGSGHGVRDEGLRHDGILEALIAGVGHDTHDLEDGVRYRSAAERGEHLELDRAADGVVVTVVVPGPRLEIAFRAELVEGLPPLSVGPARHFHLGADAAQGRDGARDGDRRDSGQRLDASEGLVEELPLGRAGRVRPARQGQPRVEDPFGVEPQAQVSCLGRGRGARLQRLDPTCQELRGGVHDRRNQPQPT